MARREPSRSCGLMTMLAAITDSIHTHYDQTARCAHRWESTRLPLLEMAGLYGIETAGAWGPPCVLTADVAELGNWKLMLCREPRHWAVSSATWLQSMPYLRSILILSFNVSLNLPNGLLPESLRRTVPVNNTLTLPFTNSNSRPDNATCLYE